MVIWLYLDKHNINVVANGIDELKSLNIRVQDLRDKLVKDRKEQLINEDGIIEKWATTEQEPYNLEAVIICEFSLPILYINYISPTAKIDCTIEQLRNTLKSMMCLPHNQEYKEKQHKINPGVKKKTSIMPQKERYCIKKYL